MLNAAKLEAAGQLADRHVIGIDHAGQIFAWVRLADLAHAEQSIQSNVLGGGGVRMDSCHGATSKRLEHVSVRDSSAKLYLGVRHGRAVTRRGTATAASAVREREVFLRQVHAILDPPPYV